MTELFAAALDLQRFCTERSWKFCFIGGVAVQRWGEPRFTKDADMTLLTGFSGAEAYVDALLTEFSPRRPDARELALQRRVLLLTHRDGVTLDVALGAFSFEAHSIERASWWQQAPDVRIFTCGPEDLIVHKAFANRDLDWMDVERIIMRQGRKLDVDLIWRELRPLVELKEEPDILTRLQRKLDEHLD